MREKPWIYTHTHRVYLPLCKCHGNPDDVSGNQRGISFSDYNQIQLLWGFGLEKVPFSLYDVNAKWHFFFICFHLLQMETRNQCQPPPSRNSQEIWSKTKIGEKITAKPFPLRVAASQINAGVCNEANWGSAQSAGAELWSDCSGEHLRHDK